MLNRSHIVFKASRIRRADSLSFECIKIIWDREKFGCICCSCCSCCCRGRVLLLQFSYNCNSLKNHKFIHYQDSPAISRFKYRPYTRRFYRTWCSAKTEIQISPATTRTQGEPISNNELTGGGREGGLIWQMFFKPLVQFLLLFNFFFESLYFSYSNLNMTNYKQSTQNWFKLHLHVRER